MDIDYLLNEIDSAVADLDVGSAIALLYEVSDHARTLAEALEEQQDQDWEDSLRNDEQAQP